MEVWAHSTKQDVVFNCTLVCPGGTVNGSVEASLQFAEFDRASDWRHPTVTTTQAESSFPSVAWLLSNLKTIIIIGIGLAVTPLILSIIKGIMDLWR